MNPRALPGILCAALTLSAPSHAASPVRLARKTAARVPVAVVTVDLRSPRVTVEPLLARGGIGKAESLRSMARRAEPEAVITGGFFDTHSLLPIGDIIVDGEMLHFGGRGAGIVLRRDSHKGTLVRLRSNAGTYRHTRWGKPQHVLAGALWLLRDGKPAFSLKKQGFSGQLAGPHARAAVGLTRGGQLLLVATGKPIRLSQWARALRSLGARDALNLDGGSSTGLYFHGKAIVQPGRRLTNALAVYLKPASGHQKP